MLDGLAASLNSGSLRTIALGNGASALNCAGIFRNFSFRMLSFSVDTISAIGSKEKAATTDIDCFLSSRR